MRRIAISALFLSLAAGCQMALPVPSGPGAAPAATAPSGTRAETACRAGAQEAGLSVASIVATRPTPAGEEVTLAVTRGSQSFELRCLYVAETDEARIMML